MTDCRMLRLIALALVLGFPSHGLCGSTASSSADPAAAERLFVVEFTVGPAWVHDKPPHEQLHFKEHSENLRRLRTEGRLVLGARYSDKGLVVLKAATEAEAKAQVDRDESVKAGVFRAEVFDFRPFYDGCVSKPDAPQARGR